MPKQYKKCYCVEEINDTDKPNANEVENVNNDDTEYGPFVSAEPSSSASSASEKPSTYSSVSDLDPVQIDKSTTSEKSDLSGLNIGGRTRRRKSRRGGKKSRKTRRGGKKSLKTRRRSGNKKSRRGATKRKHN